MSIWKKISSVAIYLGIPLFTLTMVTSWVKIELNKASAFDWAVFVASFIFSLILWVSIITKIEILEDDFDKL